MILKVGMILLCNFNFYGINTYKVRLKNVPTIITALTLRDAVVEYNLENIPNFEFLHDDQKITELVSKEDVNSSYMNCKEKK